VKWHPVFLPLTNTDLQRDRIARSSPGLVVGEVLPFQFAHFSIVGNIFLSGKDHIRK
jgi:hypothetical protein